MGDKTKKGIFFIVRDDIYRLPVFCSFGQSDDDIVKSLSKYSKGLIYEKLWHLYPNDATPAFTYKYDGGQVLIRFRCYPDTPERIGYLSHEIFHAAEEVFDHIGLLHDNTKSSEAWAYYIQYLTETILKRVWK